MSAELDPSIPIRAHFHNTRNTGYANALAAIEAGVSVLDASAGGIGGCPFAPGATGNIATEDLAYLLDRSGFATGVDRESVAATGTWISDRSASPRPPPCSGGPAGSPPEGGSAYGGDRSAGGRALDVVGVVRLHPGHQLAQLAAGLLDGVRLTRSCGTR